MRPLLLTAWAVLLNGLGGWSPAQAGETAAEDITRMSLAA